MQRVSLRSRELPAAACRLNRLPAPALVLHPGGNLIALEAGLSIDSDQLVDDARRHLRRLFDASAPAVPQRDSESALPRVNVTLRTLGAVRGSMSGRGQTLREQLLDAVERAARDSRFSGAMVKADLEKVSIEVWLQLSSELIPLDARTGPQPIRWGEEGVEVLQGSAFAYYKPSVALTSKFTNPQDLFDGLCKKASLPQDAWKDASCVLRKTSWVHLCETPGGEVTHMVALRPTGNLTVTSRFLTQCVSDHVSYFKQSQQADGSFCYRYLPFPNVARKEAANPVRSSGCAYAVAKAASAPFLDSDQDLKQCARRAVAEILGRSVALDLSGSFISSRPGGRGGKLGSTALLLLALLTPALSADHEEDIDNFLAAIKASQLDSGLFACVFGTAKEGGSQINFFPGQAILALVVKAMQGDESCRPFYRRAFAPYRAHFRRSPSTAFVGWHADAWSRAALLDGNAEFAEFVFEQTDWLLRLQLTDDKDSLYWGGFSKSGKPPDYSSIVYTEAVARAAGLAYRAGDPRWEGYRDACRAGITFCSRLRLMEEQSVFFAHPLRAIGGVARSLSNFEVRSDVVQHAITLALTFLDTPILLDSPAETGAA